MPSAHLRVQSASLDTHSTRRVHTHSLRAQTSLLWGCSVWRSPARVILSHQLNCGVGDRPLRVGSDPASFGALIPCMVWCKI